MYMRDVGITHLPPHRESSLLTLANMHYREAPTGSLKTVESGDLFGDLHYLFIYFSSIMELLFYWACIMRLTLRVFAMVQVCGFGTAE